MKPVRIVLRSALPFLIAVPVLWLTQDSVSPGWTIVLISAGINVILAVSLNVVNGFTGQFSIGHAGFAAVGAYTAAKITTAMYGLQNHGALAGRLGPGGLLPGARRRHDHRGGGRPHRRACRRSVSAATTSPS